MATDCVIFIVKKIEFLTFGLNVNEGCYSMKTVYTKLILIEMKMNIGAIYTKMDLLHFFTNYSKIWT